MFHISILANESEFLIRVVKCLYEIVYVSC